METSASFEARSAPSSYSTAHDWRSKLDHNLPTDLASMLRQAGHDVATAQEENLSRADDPIILAAAAAEIEFS